MKDLINFHIHSTGSDGNLPPEEVVKEAIKHNIKYLCFTDHYRRPSETETDWSTANFHQKNYVDEIRRLQKQYKESIDISFGAEFDWLPNHGEWLKKEISRDNYDYVLGSVHFVFSDRGFDYFMFGSEGNQKWKKVAEKFGSPRKLVEEYYRNLRNMIKSGIYDSVGHFDVIKIHNNPELFSEKENWYIKEVITTLDILKESGMAMEINTSGLRRDVKSVYPSPWILKEAKKRNIPLTIGTDAHSREAINAELDYAYELAKKAGYHEIVRFKARKMIRIPI
jgi:histidinol-phosphatase (PHP family)